jgi:hypothetical protein
MFIDELFGRLWAQYVEITPRAERIHRLLGGRGEKVVHDHIGLRTFDVPDLDIGVLDRAFVDAGYQPAESYEFPDDKLVATYYSHRERNLPKVFISALEVERCSPEMQSIVGRLVEQMEPGLTARAYFSAMGRPWDLSIADYEALRAESAYAAWVAAFGFRASLFAADAGALSGFSSLAELNAFLEAQGVELDRAGGAIKGSPAEHLEQSSTLEDRVEVEFSDGKKSIPSCCYGFARRYPMADGMLYEGFGMMGAL